MAVQIIEYFETADKEHWIDLIEESNWEASKYLSKLLREDKLRDLCGPETKLYLVVENKNLYAFCTLAQQDEVKAPEMTPWIGFVYTFPEHRGNHYAAMLIEHVCKVAKENGAKEIFSSPSLDTAELYEKYGFSCLSYTMPTIYGYETSVFRKEL